MVLASPSSKPKTRRLSLTGVEGASSTAEWPEAMALSFFSGGRSFRCSAFISCHTKSFLPSQSCRLGSHTHLCSNLCFWRAADSLLQNLLDNCRSTIGATRRLTWRSSRWLIQYHLQLRVWHLCIQSQQAQALIYVLLLAWCCLSHCSAVLLWVFLQKSQLSKNNPDLLITLVCKVTVVQPGLVDLILFVLLFCAQLAHCTLEFGARQHPIGSNSQETTKQSFHFADPSTVGRCFPRPSHFVRGAHNTVQIKVYCPVCDVRQEHLHEVSRIRSEPELLGSCHGCTHQKQSGWQFFTESHRCIITFSLKLQLWYVLTKTDECFSGKWSWHFHINRHYKVLLAGASGREWEKYSVITYKTNNVTSLVQSLDSHATSQCCLEGLMLRYWMLLRVCATLAVNVT